jgi:anti-sigma factor RsiW
MTDAERERIEELLMRAVDDLLDQAEREELEALLDRHPDYRAELDDFRRIKETTDAMTARIVADFEREPPREPPATRTLHTFAFLLLLSSTLVLLGFAAWGLFVEEEIPLLLKVAFAVGGIGTGLLFAHVLRIRMRGRDPYEEIDL